MGELRLKVTDPAGLGLKSSVELICDANHYRQGFVTNDAGKLVVRRLAFGIYRLQVRHERLTPSSNDLEIRSALPIEYIITLGMAPVSTSIEVTANRTLIDPDRTSSIAQIGAGAIQTRPSSLPGRSLQDLVSSQPGWLYEGNAVLHPRGTEYQTQFVVDGIPFTDNRSPGYGTEIEADKLQSINIYTGGIPAEYGRMMGGVVELNTGQDNGEGVHGQFAISDGSFDTTAGDGTLQCLRGKDTYSLGGYGAMTGRYLSPPVPQNYTNTASTGGFGVSYAREFTANDRLTLMFRHALARYEVPNEQVQQSSGQRQTGNTVEDMGMALYQHLFSANLVGNLAAMVREKSYGLSSNLLSTPVIAFQSNSFTEGYVRGTVSNHHHHQEWKAGFDADNVVLHEEFADLITDPSRFDPGTPNTFRFLGSRAELDQSAFIEDVIAVGQWTVRAGLRWDHYQLILSQNAISPRLGVSRYFASANLTLHAAYDRVFQTPASENILLSSSPEVVVLNPNVLHVPVEPSRGSYYEAGMVKAFLGRFSLDTTGYLRQFSDFADDNLLLNTPVAFPIAFRKAQIYGAEAKLNLPLWGKLSGYTSYSYMVGSAYFPVIGGLFLGQAATDALTQLSGRFWVTQDQRNTVRTRFRYQFVPRLWGAVGLEYGSGLPIDFDGTYQQALAEYGRAVIDRIDFSRGRVLPNLSLDASLGAELWAKDNVSLRLQFDAENLNDRVNLINFAGLFSGNSVAPPRSYSVRLRLGF